MNSATVAEKIEKQILSKLDPLANIKVIDETHKHIKHKGYKEGKYHFILNICSEKLANMSKISSHREIFKSVDSLMPYIHALSIKIEQE